MTALKPRPRRKDGLVAIMSAFAGVMTRPRDRNAHARTLFNLTDESSFEPALLVFNALPAGAALLSSRPDSAAILRDRAGMAAMPEGTLGRSYQGFMVGNRIDESVYLADPADIERAWRDDRERAWFQTHINVAHDLRHVITGYGNDAVGEMCLLFFRYAQTRNPGVALVAGFAAAAMMVRGRRGLFRSAREAYRHGKAARLLDLLPWEIELDRSLEAIRAEFSIASPRVYLAFKEERAAARRRKRAKSSLSPAGRTAR